MATLPPKSDIEADRIGEGAAREPSFRRDANCTQRRPLREVPKAVNSLSFEPARRSVRPGFEGRAADYNRGFADQE
jgi:hypothetical protein